MNYHSQIPKDIMSLEALVPNLSYLSLIQAETHFQIEKRGSFRFVKSHYGFSKRINGNEYF